MQNTPGRSNLGTRLERRRTIEPNIGNKSPDQRWIVVPSGNDVLLVDLEFKNTPDEKAYRESKAKPKLWWHLEQATKAELASNWYAAAFHRAWLTKTTTDPFDRLRKGSAFLLAFGRLKKEYESEQKDLDSVLPPIIRETLLNLRRDDKASN